MRSHRAIAYLGIRVVWNFKRGPLLCYNYVAGIDCTLELRERPGCRFSEPGAFGFHDRKREKE